MVPNSLENQIISYPGNTHTFQEVIHNKIAKSANQQRKRFAILTMHAERSFMCSVNSTKDRASKRLRTIANNKEVKRFDCARSFGKAALKLWRS